MIVPISILFALISALIISIVGLVFLANRKSTPIDKLAESNANLRMEVESLKSQLSHSEKRRKNLLSINKGERALIPGYPLVFGSGTKDAIEFKAYCEVDVVEVTDKKIKVSPYKVITDNNQINSDQSRLQGIIDYIKDKWVDISECEPILDTQVRREDKLEELDDVLK